MPEDRPNVPDRYSLVIKRHGSGLTRPWMWEILRAPKPLGVRFYCENFNSEKAARLSGEKALYDLLQGVTKEAG
jgi:hypothetical protein